MGLGPMANHWLDINHYHLDLLRLRRQFGMILANTPIRLQRFQRL